MAIEIKCQCGSAYRLDDSRAGQMFACKVCGASMQLSAGAPRATLGAAPPPVLVNQVASPAGASVADDVKATAAAPLPSIQEPLEGLEESLPDIGERLPGPSFPGDQSPDPSAAQPASPPRPAIAPVPVEKRGPQQVRTPVVASPVAPPATSSPTAPAGRPARRRKGKPKYHPPASWWFVRMLMLGTCVIFLWLPWWGSWLEKEEMRAEVEKALGTRHIDNFITGWDQVRLPGQVSSKTSSIQGLDSGKLASSKGNLHLGVTLFTWAPTVFAAGLALAGLMVVVTYHTDGRGAIWPFLVCWAGLLMYIAGWQMMITSSPFAEFYKGLTQGGMFALGMTKWMYGMLILLIPVCMIARLRPDRSLESAQMIR